MTTPRSRTAAITVVSIILVCILLAGGQAASAISASNQAGGNTKEAALSSVKSLADRIVAAPTDDARYKVLLDVMRQLNIGVYTSTGTVLVKGAERGEQDFYLYDFEVKILAQSWGRHQTFGIADLARTLPALGASFRDPKNAAGELRQALLTGVRDATEKSNASPSLAPLLFRELGLRQTPSYDAARNGELEAFKLDALQCFLVMAEIVTPVVRAPREVAFVPLSGHLASMVQPTNFAGGSIGATVQLVGVERGPDQPRGNNPEGNKGETWLPRVVRDLNEVRKGIKIIIKDFHAVLMSLCIIVESMPPALLQTHYGPASGNHRDSELITPGTKLEFRVLVTMVADLPETVVKYGPLVGFKAPKKGPVAGMHMIWESISGTEGATTGIGKHGSVSGGEVTGPDGIATVVFTPKNEQGAGKGMEKEEAGTVSAYALSVWDGDDLPMKPPTKGRAIGTIIGIGLQVPVMLLQYGTTAWKVRWHDDDIPIKIEIKNNFGPNSHTIIEGRLTNSSPSDSPGARVFRAILTAQHDGHYNGGPFSMRFNYTGSQKVEVTLHEVDGKRNLGVDGTGKLLLGIKPIERGDFQVNARPFPLLDRKWLTSEDWRKRLHDELLLPRSSWIKGPLEDTPHRQQAHDVMDRPYTGKGLDLAMDVTIGEEK
jgi:hypothetical protein